MASFLLKEILERVLTDDGDWRTTLLRQWPDIVGNLHSRMALDRIDGSTLIVTVHDSHWMHQLFMMSRFLVQTINRNLGGNYVTHIRFYTKPLAARPVTVPPLRYQPRSIELASHHIKALALVPDEELREAMRTFLERCLQS